LVGEDFRIRGVADIPQGVMAGLVPATHGVRGIELPQASASRKKLCNSGLFANWDPSFQRRGVDGRDKPGHDGSDRQPTANAIRANIPSDVYG
jgi:hypothetical protein